MMKKLLHKLKVAKGEYNYRETLKYGLSVLLAKAFFAGAMGAARLFRMRYAPPARKKGSVPKRVALVMPVIPDLSHHFLYREAYQLLDELDLKLFSVFKGKQLFHTDETRALVELNEYYVDLEKGRHRVYMSFVRHLLTNPVKTTNLLLFYKDYLSSEPAKFITFGAIRDFCHPIFGFMLADRIAARDVSHIHVYCSNITTNHAIGASHLLDKSLSFTGYVDFDFYYIFKMLKEKMELADFMVVHTDFCKKRMLGYVGEEFADKIHVVRIGLDFEGLKQYGSRRSDYRGLRLVAICGLVEKKGLRYLIDACGIIRESMPDFLLYIIGDGPLKGSLMEQARDMMLEDRVIFTGALPNRRVFDYLTEDSILVMPSIYTESGERDGIPTVIIEAMSMGVNVVSTTVSGIPEVVEDGVNGLLVEPGDSGELARAIMRLHGDRELFERLRKSGYPKVVEMFNVRKNADRLAGLINSSLAR